MRENPWHLRIPTTEHFQWFSNLVELHEITTAWLQEVQTERPSYLLTRGLSPELTKNLWMLDHFSKNKLEDFLDDTTPEHLLSRLEHTLWAVQAWTLNHFYEHSEAKHRNATETVLEQICWKQGRKCAETRWKLLTNQGNQDLRNILLAFKHSPFSGYPQGDSFLIKRATPAQIQIELRACPHQIQFTEVKPIANELCKLHSHWMRGFAYALNHRVNTEFEIQTPRCLQTWYYA